MAPSRWQAVALLVLGMATLVGSAVSFYRRSGWGTPDLEIVAAGSPAPISDSTRPVPAQSLMVHVTGEVRNSGVLRLPIGARGIDAVREAGGATPHADLEAINLAAPLQDGEQLHIPAKTADTAATVGVTTRPATNGPRGSEPIPQPAPGAETAKLAKPGHEFVRINSAGSDELQRLPGIGPAMADRILEYRKENGRFTSVEQLMEVPGIGPKKLDKMKPYVRL